MKNAVALSLSISLVSAVYGAGRWVWTGTDNGSWTNAANWTVDGVVATVPPGMYIDPSGGDQKAGALDSSVVFGSVGDGAATTIDLDGFWDISNIVVTAGAPHYTFGVSGDQSLTLFPSGGVFRVERGATAPSVAAAFGYRYPRAAVSDFNKYWRTNASIINDSTDTLVFEKMFFFEPSVRFDETAFQFAGCGDIRISGLAKYKQLVYIDLVQTSGAKLVWDCSVTNNWNIGAVRKVRNLSGYVNEIEIADGGVLSGYPGMGPFEIGGSLTLSGNGTYLCNVGQRAGNRIDGGSPYVDQQNRVDDRGMLNVLCNVDSVLRDGVCYGGWCVNDGGGTTVFGDRNFMRGGVKVTTSYDYTSIANGKIPTVSVASIGLDGERSGLGYAGIYIANGGRLLYTGAGETCTKPFCITNMISRLSNADVVDGNPYARLEQGGSGKLVFNSKVVSRGRKLDGVTVVDATLELANSTAQEAEIGSPLGDNTDAGRLNLKKTGSGTWRMTAANAYTGFTAVEGGTLAIGATGSIAASSGVSISGGARLLVEGSADGTRSVALPKITAGPGLGILALSDGVNVTLSGVETDSGSLNVVMPASASLKVMDATLIPGGITINGESAMLDGDGYVVRRTYEADVSIPARGGRIPDSAGKTVAITSAGDEADGPIALADGLSSATIGVLAQNVSTPATVDLSGGRTLSVKTVAISDGGAALTVGAAPGEGTLAVADGASALEFDAASDAGDITVLSALSVPTAVPIANVGTGLARLWWPVNWIGELKLSNEDCVLALTNESDIAFSSTLVGNGILRKEGTGNWTLSKDQSQTFLGTFEIAGGEVAVSAVGQFGGDGGRVVVTNGGTLRASGELAFGNREVCISGKGADGRGALSVSKPFIIPQLTLAGDAMISVAEGSRNDLSLGERKYGSGSGSLNMNGHRLIKDATSDMSILISDPLVVTNAGSIVYEPLCVPSNQWSYLRFYSDVTNVGGGNGLTVEAASGTRIILEESSPMIHCGLRILADADKDGPEMSFNGGVPGSADGVNTNRANWGGPIEIVNENTWLSFHPWHESADRYITISGQISGNGGVTYGQAAKSAYKSNSKGHVIFAHPNNTYTGPTILNGNAGSSLSIFHPGSIPDWSKLNLKYGRIGAYVGDGFFTEADVLAAVNSSATFDGALDDYSENGKVCQYAAAVLAVNTTYAPGKSFTLNLSDSAIQREDGFSVGHDGPGTLNVTGSWTKPVNFGCFNGSLVFSGNSQITLGAGTVAGDYDRTEGSVLIENVPEVRFVGGKSVLIGGYVNLTSVGRMTIRNSNVMKDLPADGDRWIGNYDAMVVGHHGAGILTIDGDCAITNRHVVGYIEGYGSLRKRGGYVYDCAPSDARPVVVGFGSYGYLEHDGGTYEICGFASVARTSNARGVFVMRDGVMSIAGSDKTNKDTGRWDIANGGNAVGQVLIAGGYATNLCDTALCREANSRSYLTVSGGEYINYRPANSARCRTGDTLTVFNLNGGIFGAWDVAKACATYAEGVKSPAYVNFNGGTFRSMSAQPLFGEPNGQDWYAAIDRVTVYEKGARIDIPELSIGKDNSVDVPLSAPTGQGVASVAWIDTGVKYVGAPVVEIIGDGTGASAMAEFDSEREEVTGIMVTSPGCDYTWAKAIIWYGDKDAAVTNEAVTLATFKSGGFTKSGAGRLLLNVANTYSGATVIEEGELVVNAEGAIPPGSDIVFKGGILTAGTGISLPAATFRFNVLENAVYPGAFTFPAGSKVAIDNLDKVDRAVGSYTVATFTKGIAGELPDVANVEDMPCGWRVMKSGKAIKVRYVRGSVFSIR